MKIYLVGGAVRDELMGVVDADKDWVVVGATPEDLIFEGYTPVGKDFPVFLHPETGEEYALARTERKTAPGYHGFVFHADPSITIEEDLARRDLTINAIAKDVDGHFIDPFKGREDIKNRVFRHVSPAFKEDPVRILRLARFAARYPEFTIAPETQTLLQQMCENGEVDALVSERVWQELSKGLMANNPFKMLEVLLNCGALRRLFPRIKDKDLKTPQLQILRDSLTNAAQTDANLPVRFAILNFMCPVAQELRAPKECNELAELLVTAYQSIANAINFDAPGLLSLFYSCDALRRPERFTLLLSAYAGLSKFLNPDDEQRPTSSQVLLEQMHQVALSIDHKDIATRAIKDGLVAQQIGIAIDDARQSALAQALLNLKNS